MFDWMKGKKTYVLAALGALTVIVTWMVGDITTKEMLEGVWASGIAAAIRNGIG